MNDQQRVDWLSENAVMTKWTHTGGWTVQCFGCSGSGPTFREAIDEAARVQAERFKDVKRF